GELAVLQGSYVFASADRSGGIARQDLDDVLRRENEAERPQFLSERIFRQERGIRAVAIRNTSLPQKAGIHGALASARERFHWERIEIAEARIVIEAASGADPLVFGCERREENSERRHHRNARARDCAYLIPRELADMGRVYQHRRVSSHSGKRVVDGYCMREHRQPEFFSFIDDDC